MNSHRVRQSSTALVLVLVLAFTAACSSIGITTRSYQHPASINRSIEYGQLARGDSPQVKSLAIGWLKPAKA